MTVPKGTGSKRDWSHLKVYADSPKSPQGDNRGSALDPAHWMDWIVQRFSTEKRQ